MKTIDQKAIAKAVAEAAPRYHVRQAHLFGSYARGEADGASDIDVCIECGSGFTLFSLGGFSKSLEDALGLPVDVVCGEESFYPRALERYRKDKVLLYEAS